MGGASNQPVKEENELSVAGNTPPNSELFNSRGDDYHRSQFNATCSVDDKEIVYFKGIRLYAINFVIGCVFFLTTIDATIATTALVSITSDLGGFGMSSWVLTSYQLGYAALIVVVAKLSDILGRKPVFLFSIFAFTVFSGVCAAAQTLVQLIILRAFQGLGASGCFALGAIVLVESVPPSKYAETVAKNGVSIVLATALGPVIGGAITKHTTWRWIFLINIPIGVLAFIVGLVGIPNGFPYHSQAERRPVHAKFKMIWARIDLLGSVLLILASLAFTACFQEADSTFAWDSAYVIILLVASVILWAALLVWERRTTLAGTLREPVLPWRFFTSRVMGGLLLGFVFIGAPLAVSYFQLPQRFQLVNGMSSLDAGVRVLPFGLSSSAGVLLSGRMASRLKVPCIYLIITGAVFQVVGFALLSTIGDSKAIPPAMYGYLVLAGLGCGFNYSVMLIMVPFAAEKKDGAVALGAANQLRTMGSAIGLAISTSVFNGYASAQFKYLGMKTSLEDITYTSQVSMPIVLNDTTRHVLSEAYNHQMLVLCAFAAAQVPTAFLLWKKKQIVAV